MHLDGCFVHAEPGPGEQREAEVYGDRVQGVQAVVQIRAVRVRGIERSRNADRDLGEVGVDSPVVRVIRIGQRGPRHATVKTHVVKLAAQGSQTGLDIAKSFPVGQLREGHRKILIPAREASRSRIAAVTRDATPELAIRQKTQQLGENGTALIHGPLSLHLGRRFSVRRHSNRGKPKVYPTLSHTMIWRERHHH